MFSRKVFLKAVRIYRMRPKGEVPNDFWLRGERGVTGAHVSERWPCLHPWPDPSSGNHSQLPPRHLLALPPTQSYCARDL